MLDEKTLDLLIQRVVGAGISPSTAQNQGPPETMARAIKFLYRPSLLTRFSNSINREDFLGELDAQTEELRLSLPLGTKKNGDARGQHWGSARKFLNIYLLDCCLNRYLFDRYSLANIEPWLEVPLDSYVGNGLSQEQENVVGPDPLAWNTIIGLTKDTSERYQNLAQRVATRMHMYRAHLDLHYLKYQDAEVET